MSHTHSHETKVTISKHKKLAHSRHEFEVEVEAGSMIQHFDHAYQHLAAGVEVKGFRPGQAPKLLTLKKIGQERYAETALEYALRSAYAEAMRELDLHPVAPPEISIHGYGEGAPFSFKVAVDVIPEVDPGNYLKHKVTAPKADVSVKASDVTEVIERLRKQQAEVKPVDRAAKKGDRVEIDYVGMVDNVKRDNLSSQHYPLVVGDGILPKELEAELVGKKKGDTFKVNAEVKKEKVAFEVAVHEVAEVNLAELTPKFAEQFGRKDIDDLKQAIEDSLKQEKEQAARQELETKVLDTVMEHAKVDLPQSLIEEEITRRLDGMKQQLGVMFPTFLKEQKKDEEQLRKDLTDPAKASVKAGLVLGEIAKREKFGVDRIKDESEAAFQRRVVRRTIDFLVANTTTQPKK